MADGEGVEIEEVEMEDIEGVVGDCERLFVVGELVEFWVDLWFVRIGLTAVNLHL